MASAFRLLFDRIQHKKASVVPVSTRFQRCGNPARLRPNTNGEFRGEACREAGWCKLRYAMQLNQDSKVSNDSIMSRTTAVCRCQRARVNLQ